MSICFDSVVFFAVCSQPVRGYIETRRNASLLNCLYFPVRSFDWERKWVQYVVLQWWDHTHVVEWHDLSFTFKFQHGVLQHFFVSFWICMKEAEYREQNGIIFFYQKCYWQAAANLTYITLRLMNWVSLAYQGPKQHYFNLCVHDYQLVTITPLWNTSSPLPLYSVSPGNHPTMPFIITGEIIIIRPTFTDSKSCDLQDRALQ